MFGLALLAGYGENTWIHGVGDGAPWIAQQLAEVFPRQRYLLERYHLLEHLHLGATGLPGEHPEAAKAWVARQVECIDQGRVAEIIAECRAGAWGSGGEPLAAVSGLSGAPARAFGLCDG